MRRLSYPAVQGPRAWGRIHGECYRGEIRSLADLRWYLTEKVYGLSRADTDRLAAMHLPVLERYDRALYEELLGIAEGSATRPEDIVVLNHYTDLRDIDARAVLGSTASSAPAPARPADDPGVTLEDGCTALWARTASGAVLAQTWDMHASAMPYVMLLELPDTDAAPGGVLLTLTGCLGMCGVNAEGVGITINNLVSTDARAGLLWPALVRRAIRESSAAAARDVVLGAPLGGGHHYLVADRRDVFGIETSGTRCELVFAGGEASYVHTNHCFGDSVADCSRVPAGSTTFERLDWLRGDLARKPVRDVRDAYARLGSHDGYPRSVCTNMATGERPHQMATCAAIAIDLERCAMLAVAGFPHNVAPERIALGGDEPPA